MHIKTAVLWFLITTLFSINSLYATHGEQYQKINGIAIYLAIMPAEMLRGHPKDHPESRMHTKQRIEGENQHHIMISLFDEKTGLLLKGATVKIRVLGEKFVGPMTQLELMVMGGTQSYGNFFSVPNHGSYQVELEVSIKGKMLKTIFQYASA